MKVLDLFSGSKSLEQPCLDLGLQYFSIDNVPEYEPDLVADISLLFPDDISFLPDVVWASPPCTSFSVASIGHHWKMVGDRRYPQTKEAILDVGLLQHTVFLAKALKPKFFFIENPRGMMRKMKVMEGLRSVYVTYCRYGADVMKPTDIWTNSNLWLARPPCRNGDSCHEAASRGEKRGTQGIASAYERGRVPYELLKEVLLSCTRGAVFKPGL